MTDEQRTWEEAEKLFHESVSEMKKIYERLGIDSKTNGLFWADAELKRLREAIEWAWKRFHEKEDWYGEDIMRRAKEGK